MTNATAERTNTYLTEGELAGELQVKPQTLSVWRCQGRGPAFVKVGRCVRYRRADVEAFIEGRVHNTSSDR